MTLTPRLIIAGVVLATIVAVVVIYAVGGSGGPT
jgi:hypothetical protein